MPDFSENLRRLMSRDGLTVVDVASRTGLDKRTVVAILSGNHQKPHALTLKRLADGLGVSVDELFQNPTVIGLRLFDRATNPVIEQVLTQHAEIFDGWTDTQLDELYSRFGAGGALTSEGVVHTALAMNRRFATLEKAAAVLEGEDAELLVNFVDLLFVRFTDTPQ